MFVIVAGGGRTGATLATLLVEQHHEVRILEHRPDVLAHIHRELPTEIIYEGNALSPVVLEDAGIGRADVVAASMQSDAENLALCYLARTRYAVRRTIACINHPGHAWLFDQKFHVDVALNQAEILARLIEEEMSLGDMMTLLKLRKGTFSVVEEKIPPGAPAVGVSIQDLHLPPNSVIAAIIRKRQIVIPRGAVTFEVGDEVLAVVDSDSADRIAELFSSPVRPTRG